MPKERRQRIAAHAPSAKICKTLPVDVVEHVEATPDETLDSNFTILSTEPQPLHSTKKKDRQLLKREAFLQKLESAPSPYSKSHNRRIKRKAKEQIAGGLEDIQKAIAALEDPTGPLNNIEEPTNESSTGSKAPKPKIAQIGEGKGSTLTKAQRKRALEMERLRHPLILSNPQFSSSPFETIRAHAQNTLLQHASPPIS